MSQHIDNWSEPIKVGFIGAFGFLTSLKLADVATLVSIAVGVLTFVYVGIKIYYLLKSKGRAALD